MFQRSRWWAHWLAVIRLCPKTALSEDTSVYIQLHCDQEESTGWWRRKACKRSNEGVNWAWAWEGKDLQVCKKLPWWSLRLFPGVSSSLSSGHRVRNPFGPHYGWWSHVKSSSQQVKRMMYSTCQLDYSLLRKPLFPLQWAHSLFLPINGHVGTWWLGPWVINMN